MKNICILGSTGSIGRSSLEVVANFPDRFRVRYLTANKNIDLLQEQVRRFAPDGVGVLDPAMAIDLKGRLNGSARVFAGAGGLAEIARQDNIDIVISSLVGFAGLLPTLEAIKRGRTIALANKETLVVAGELVTRMAKEYGATVIPVDSEHSAIMQCLTGERPEAIARLILTASGGPFRAVPREQFAAITVEEALAHPNWKMGSKITIDSATMMNKGLEVIEAHWLFGLPPEKIEVIIHPQSIIHSMVEFVDGSIKAQLGLPDMKLPIQYALTHPERQPADFGRVDFAELGRMTFHAPDLEKFECLALAYAALREGGTAPAILNAANEIAVDLFLSRRLTFERIPGVIRAALDAVPAKHSPSLDDIIEADTLSRAAALHAAGRMMPDLMRA